MGTSLKRGRWIDAWKTSLVLGVLLAFSGCSTKRPGYAPFFADPQRYSRVALVCLSVQTEGDPTTPKKPLTRDECEESMVNTIQSQANEVLRDRRYELSTTPPLVRISHASLAEDASDPWSGLIAQVANTTFVQRDSETPYDLNLVLEAATLRESLDDADAWLIIVSKARFESVAERSKRTKGDLAGNVAAAPLALIAVPLIAAMSPLMAVEAIGGGKDAKTKPADPTWIQHGFLLLDPRTKQVLWSHWRLFDGEDARSRDTLQATVKDMFEYLPEIPKRARQPAER